MSEQFNKTFKLGDDRSRTHIPGFNIPDFKVERFNGEPLLAHLFLKHLSDVIDSDKCAYIFDKHHELADVSHLERIQVRDEDRRKRELIAYEATYVQWETDLAAALMIWQNQLIPLGAMPAGPLRDAAITGHMTQRPLIFIQHPEPILGQFQPFLLSTEATALASRKVELLKRKNDADKCLIRFKALAGPKITVDLSRIWDDPSLESIDKARICYDYFLQCQHTDAENTVARLTADMNALLPATTVQGGLLLYQKMNILQETLSKVGAQYAMDERLLIATIRTKLVGDAFDNLKFFHKQTEGNSRPLVRTSAEFGTPAPARAADHQVSWTQLGDNLLELSETKAASSSSCLSSEAFVSTQEESMVMYARQQQQPQYQQYNRYPPPYSYQQQPSRNFVPAAGPPPWLGQSRPFQQFVQPLGYNIPAGQTQTP